MLRHQLLAQPVAGLLQQPRDIGIGCAELHAETTGLMAEMDFQTAQLRWVQANAGALLPLLKLDFDVLAQGVEHLLAPLGLRTLQPEQALGPLSHTPCRTLDQQRCRLAALINTAELHQSLWQLCSGITCSCAGCQQIQRSPRLNDWTYGKSSRHRPVSDRIGRLPTGQLEGPQGYLALQPCFGDASGFTFRFSGCLLWRHWPTRVNRCLSRLNLHLLLIEHPQQPLFDRPLLGHFVAARLGNGFGWRRRQHFLPGHGLLQRFHIQLDGSIQHARIEIRAETGPVLGRSRGRMATQRGRTQRLRQRLCRDSGRGRSRDQLDHSPFLA